MIPETNEMYRYCFCMFFISGLLGHYFPTLEPFMTKFCESHMYVGVGLFEVHCLLFVGHCIGCNYDI